MKRILFVDDEPKVLDGLRRMLRSMRRTWAMEFAEGGVAALDVLSKTHVDVVVTDMRMPGMDGSELLQQVMCNYPGTVRIILSGQCDRATVLKTVCLAHQFLTKPTDSEALKAMVGRACRLQDQLADNWHREMVSCVKAVPSQPSLYEELLDELNSTEASVPRIAQRMANDVGMSAKILQLVGSGFFGSPQRIYDPQRAVSLFDLETLRALFRTTEAFAPFTSRGQRFFELDTLTEHARRVAQAAAEITRVETGCPALVEKAYLGGFFHDVGMFLLAEHVPDQHEQALVVAAERKEAFWEVEHSTFGATHADMGAYLLAIWGMDDEIIQTVAHHHAPSRSSDEKFTPLTAVHVADALCDGPFSQAMRHQVWLDEVYLDRLQLGHRVPVWEETCQSFVSEGETR